MHREGVPVLELGDVALHRLLALLPQKLHPHRFLDRIQTQRLFLRPRVDAKQVEPEVGRDHFGDGARGEREDLRVEARGKLALGESSHVSAAARFGPLRLLSSHILERCLPGENRLAKLPRPLLRLDQDSARRPPFPAARTPRDAIRSIPRSPRRRSRPPPAPRPRPAARYEPAVRGSRLRRRRWRRRPPVPPPCRRRRPGCFGEPPSAAPPPPGPREFRHRPRHGAKAAPRRTVRRAPPSLPTTAPEIPAARTCG